GVHPLAPGAESDVAARRDSHFVSERFRHGAKPINRARGSETKLVDGVGCKPRKFHPMNCASGSFERMAVAVAMQGIVAVLFEGERVGEAALLGPGRLAQPAIIEDGLARRTGPRYGDGQVMTGGEFFDQFNP